jgi:hypothetical protein
LLVSAVVLVIAATVFAGNPKVLFRDDFDSLDEWKPVLFPRIKRHSTYGIHRDSGGSYLRAESDASASGLLFKKEFDVRAYPRIRWRWKIENLYTKADPFAKSGDDYPIRVYVLFKYDPDKASLLEKAKYGFAKALYGDYPPQSSLNYVWANVDAGKRMYDSPYSDKTKIIALEQGPARLGQWITEEVDVLDGYREAFGTDPPHAASLAVMNDSDDTGGKAVSYIDFIEVAGS